MLRGYARLVVCRSVGIARKTRGGGNERKMMGCAVRAAEGIYRIYERGCAGKERMISRSAGYAENKDRENEMKDRYAGLVRATLIHTKAYADPAR